MISKWLINKRVSLHQSKNKESFYFKMKLIKFSGIKIDFFLQI